MDIQFINYKEWGIKPKGFDIYINQLKKHVDNADGILNVVFVNDSYIKGLNKQYRKKNKPTDVLSFSYLDEDTGLIGEVYISVETAKKQAKKAKHSLQDELNKLFIHGFLHIFGFDHESKEDAKIMEDLEGEVLCV